MSYPNYGYGVGYGTNPYFQGYQQPYQQNQFMNTNRQEQSQPIQNLQPFQDIPFSDVRYGTVDEAKGYIVAPNRAVMFIDQDKSQFYIKRADAMGKPTLESYKYSSLDKLSKETQTQPTELNLFVKREELNDFLTKKDLNGFLTAKDLTEINEKLAKMQKQLEINKIEKEIRN